jgi:hypothetical protein
LELKVNEVQDEASNFNVRLTEAKVGNNVDNLETLVQEFGKVMEKQELAGKFFQSLHSAKEALVTQIEQLTRKYVIFTDDEDENPKSPQGKTKVLQEQLNKKVAEKNR